MPKISMQKIKKSVNITLFFNLKLLIVLNRGLKETHIELAVDILIEVLTDSLGVTHLTDNSSVGRGDALDRPNGVVGIEVNILGRIARKVNVLCHDLSVLCKCLDRFLVAKESTLAVRDRNVVDLANPCVHKPRRIVRANSRSDYSRLMSADSVERKSRTALVRINYLSVRNKTELDKCLEAVTNTRHKTVAVL